MKRTVAVRRKTRQEGEKQNRVTGWGQHKLGDNFESRNFLHNYWVLYCEARTAYSGKLSVPEHMKEVINSTSQPTVHQSSYKHVLLKWISLLAAE